MALPGALNFPEGTTPATPSAGRRKLYPKATGWFQLDSAGVESSIANGVTSVAGLAGVVSSPALVSALATDLDAVYATDTSVATVQTNLTTHITNPTGAHAASAVANTPAGTIAATTVQAALNELDTEKATTGSVTTVASDLATHIANATGAHAATAISFAPASGIAATTVQAAIVEAKTDSTISASTPDATSNANALVLTGQQIQLGLATASFPGIISAANFKRLTNSSVIDMQRDYGDTYYCDDDYVGGGHDDTTPLQAAITASQSVKGIPIYLGSSKAGSLQRSRVTSTLNITQNSVKMIGPGRAYTTDVGNYYNAGGYWFVWRGAAGGTVLNCVPSNTGGSAIPLLGLVLDGFNIDCRDLENGTDVGANQGGKAIYLSGVAGAMVSNIFMMSASVAALDLEALVDGTFTGGGGGGTQGVLRSHFTNLCIRQLDGATRGPGIRMRGNAAITANPNFNQFHTIQIMYDGSNTGNPAMDLGDSDSNTFQMVACNRSGSSGNNWGIVIRGSNTSSAGVCRANQFFHVSPGPNGCIKCGTANGRRPDGTADASFNYTFPATDNSFKPQSTENGEPVVFYGTGATGDDGYTGGSTVVGHSGRPCTVLSSVASVGPISSVELAAVTSPTLPANFLRPGTTARFTFAGVMTNTTAATTLTLRVKKGTTTLGTITANLGIIARTNQSFKAVLLLTVRTDGAAGTCIVNGALDTYGGSPGASGLGNTATSPINTTTAETLNVTAIHSAATSTLTVTNATVEIL